MYKTICATKKGILSLARDENLDDYVIEYKKKFRSRLLIEWKYDQISE